jgi:hypothetical protein
MEKGDENCNGTKGGTMTILDENHARKIGILLENKKRLRSRYSVDQWEKIRKWGGNQPMKNRYFFRRKQRSFSIEKKTGKKRHFPRERWKIATFSPRKKITK